MNHLRQVWAERIEAGSAGPLPSLRFTYKAGWSGAGNDNAKFDTVTAFVGSEKVGFIEWWLDEINMNYGDYGQGMIKQVTVEPKWRRRGIATALLQEAQKHADFPIYHSWDLSPEGRAWATDVGGPIGWQRAAALAEAGITIEGLGGKNDVLWRAVRTLIPFREPEENNIPAREIWERARKAMSEGVDRYTPERPGSWWFMEQYDATRRFNDAKFWAGGFAPWSGPQGKHAGVGIIYEAKYAEKPPYPLTVPGGSLFVPGVKLNITAVWVTMPDGRFEKVPVNIRAVTG